MVARPPRLASLRRVAAEVKRRPGPRDGLGRDRGRKAWNQRRADKRARDRLQAQLIAMYGSKPLRRLRHKQARHGLPSDARLLLSSAREASRPLLPAEGASISTPCSSRGEELAEAWPTDKAIAGSSPPLAESVSEEEPLDDEMLALLDSHMKRAADEDRRHLCQQRFRILATCAGVRLQ